MRARRTICTAATRACYNEPVSESVDVVLVDARVRKRIHKLVLSHFADREEMVDGPYVCLLLVTRQEEGCITGAAVEALDSCDWAHVFRTSLPSMDSIRMRLRGCLHSTTWRPRSRLPLTAFRSLWQGI